MKASRLSAAMGTLFLVMLVVGTSVVVRSQSSEARFGTWRVNVGKSKYSPGPPPKSQTVKYEPWEGGYKRTIDTVDAQGQATHTELMGKYDGKDYPVSGGPPNTTVTSKRIDDRTFENVQKVNGKLTVTTRNVIARDGKTGTLTQTGQNAQGQTVNNVIAWERQ